MVSQQPASCINLRLTPSGTLSIVVAAHQHGLSFTSSRHSITPYMACIFYAVALLPPQVKDVVHAFARCMIYKTVGYFLRAWLADLLPQGQLPCFVVRQVLLKNMGSRPSLRSLLQCILASCLICQALAIENDAHDEETCVQGFAPAKRTLQAAQRNAPRTVMSSSEQVKKPTSS